MIGIELKQNDSYSKCPHNQDAEQWCSFQSGIYRKKAFIKLNLGIFSWFSYLRQSYKILTWHQHAIQVRATDSKRDPLGKDCHLKWPGRRMQSLQTPPSKVAKLGRRSMTLLTALFTIITIPFPWHLVSVWWLRRTRFIHGPLKEGKFTGKFAKFRKKCAEFRIFYKRSKNLSSEVYLLTGHDFIPKNSFQNALKFRWQRYRTVAIMFIVRGPATPTGVMSSEIFCVCRNGTGRLPLSSPIRKSEIFYPKFKDFEC